MQRINTLITPQKGRQSHHEVLPLSPFLSNLRSCHRRTAKLQMLRSPATPSKDLFTQLLGKAEPYSKKKEEEYEVFDYDMMEEEDYEMSYSREGYSDRDQNQNWEEDGEDDEEDDGCRKRKRKSTAQIKILKGELDGDRVWSKEKIAQMSHKTGLSQSQVYKWWWDQKKKTSPQDIKCLNKRKFIKKEALRKGTGYERHSHGYYIDQSMLTKPKNAIDIEEEPVTEKKINKRLVFC